MSMGIFYDSFFSRLVFSADFDRVGTVDEGLGSESNHGYWATSVSGPRIFSRKCDFRAWSPGQFDAHF